LGDFIKPAEWDYLTRPSVKALDDILGVPEGVLDHGFVRVIDYMGDEAAICQAARVSYGDGTKSVSEDRGLLRYLMRRRHSTPFEMCEIKLHVKLPIFVARQWIRHRTANVNEVSARYSILAREFHVPAAGDIAKQSTTNKQGREDGTDDMRPEEVMDIMRRAMDRSFDDYDELVDEEGYAVARETAREVLPMSTYTEWYWKVDLHNMLHFLSLRADPHAQYEIRVYADAILNIVSQWVPNVYEAFNDYRMGAHTFSRQEMEVLRKFVQNPNGFGEMPMPDVSKRELEDYKKALGI
jgi:thymidylate synthase (FAD)